MRINSQNRNSVVRVSSASTREIVGQAVVLHRDVLAKRPLFDAGCRYSRRKHMATAMPSRPAAGGARARLWASLVLSRSERT